MMRKSEVTKLKELLTCPEKGLNICAISGPGGVGKSYLLGEALREVRPAENGYLHLQVDGGAESTRRNFGKALESIAPRSLPEPAKVDRDYFAEVRKVLDKHNEIVRASREELDKKKGAPEELKSVVINLLETGKALNNGIPKSRDLLNVDELAASTESIEDLLDKAWDLCGSLRQTKLSFLPPPIRELLGLAFEDRVQNDLYGVTAERLYSDLCTAIDRYLPQDMLTTLRHPSVKGIDNLLLVIEDYEVLEPVIGEFLVGHLLRLLDAAPFTSVVIVLCRDDLAHRHIGWTHQWSKKLRHQFRLKPFSVEEARDFLNDAKIPECDYQRLIDDSEGIPFLLSQLVEEYEEGNVESAISLKKFYERTTRWLSDREREWLSQIAYLDEINLDTLGYLFEAHLIERVHNWFEQEASLRDPRSSRFQMQPTIRRKILAYLGRRSPKQHEELVLRIAKLSREWDSEQEVPR